MGVGSNKGAYLSYGIYLTGTIRKKDAETIGASQHACKSRDCFQRILAAFPVSRIQHSRGHLTVGLGGKTAFQFIFLCKLAVILDDSVVNQGYLSEAVGMRIGVCHTSVGSPAGMADSAVGYLAG